MAVTSRDLHEQPATSIFDAPISREYLDGFLPLLRIGGGMVFVVICGISTYLGVQSDLAPLAWSHIPLFAGGPSRGLLVGVAAMIIIFAGEVMTSDNYPSWYRLFLAADAFYTVRQIGPWVLELVDAHMASGVYGASLFAGIAIVEAVRLVTHWQDGVVRAMRYRWYMFLTTTVLCATMAYKGYYDVSAVVALQHVTGWLVGVTISVALSYFGEVLLFGRRRIWE